MRSSFYFFAGLEMKSQRISPQRPAIMIVSGIVDMLRVERGEKSLEQTGAVVTFPYVLGIVIQGAVADDEVELPPRLR